MSTLTKPKKPARRALAAPLSPSARLAARVRAGKFAPGADFKTIAAHGLEISAVTGLPFKPLAPGKKPISRDALKAALAAAI
jgi:hypothetical protein